MQTNPVSGMFSVTTFALLVLSATVVQGQIVQGPNGHFYQVVTASGISWDDANSLATGGSGLCGKPGHLVTITSQEENEFVDSIRAAYVSANGGSAQYWVGGYQSSQDVEPGGNWVWVNDEGPFPGANSGPAYTNWASGEPNDCGGTEEHLTLGRFANEAGHNYDGSLWNDEGCGGFGAIGGYIVEYDSDATVIIGDCDSGVPNIVVDDGYCTISDKVAECAAGAANHGQFVSCVASLTNGLKKDRLISGAQKGAIESCAAKASIP